MTFRFVRACVALFVMAIPMAGQTVTTNNQGTQRPLTSPNQTSVPISGKLKIDGISGQLQVEDITAREKKSWAETWLPILSPLLAILITIIGWTRSAKNMHLELIEQRSERAEDNGRTVLTARVGVLRKSLREFYRPFKQRSETNFKLAKLMKQGREFRTLPALLEDRAQFSDNQNALIEEIIDIGAFLTRLIDDHGGKILDEDRKYFTRVDEHFRLLRLAYSGHIQGELDSFTGKEYPRELDEIIEQRIAGLEAEVAAIELEIKNLTRVDSK